MADVRWTEAAYGDLQSTYDFIRGDSPAAAASAVRRIADAIDRLELFPESGRVLPEDPAGQYRELIVRSHRVIYRADEGVVTLLAITTARVPLDLDDLRR